MIVSYDFFHQAQEYVFEMSLFLLHLFTFLRLTVSIMGLNDQLTVARDNWNGEVAMLAKSARELLNAPTRNYAALAGVCKSLRERVTGATQFVFSQVDKAEQIEVQAAKRRFGSEIQEVATTLQPLLAETDEALQAHTQLVKIHTRWIELGFDREFITTHADCVEFLVTSGVAYSIAGFRNTLNDDPNHTIAKDQDGHPLIRLEGVMTRWEVIKEKLASLKEYDVLVSKSDENERWTYTEKGITQKDIYHYHEPFPIFSLAQTDYKALLEQGKKFYNKRHPDPKPDQFKDAIVQVCTSVGVSCRGQAPIVQKATKKIASHYGLRIITKEGKVFSFGFRRDVGELAYVRASNALGSVKGVMAMNDFDELRPHQGRYVTSIAISSEDATKILAEIVATNKNGASFDMLQSNCVEKVADCLDIAGIRVDTRESFESTINTLTYKFFKHLPYIGGCVKKVKDCVQTIFRAIPPLVAKPISVVVSIVFYVPNKLVTVAKNCFILYFGWTSASPSLAKEPYYCKRSFSPFRDLFKDRLSDLNSSKKLLRWQKMHKSTSCYPYDGKPRFNILVR